MKVAVVLVCVFAVIYASALGNIGGETSSKCLTGAGYTWCAFENKCVRPWELAREKGLEMTAENIESYCSVKRIGGGSKDSHGCIASAGYSWCSKENKCVRPWELARAQQISITTVSEFNNYCNNQTSHEVGNDADSHNCVASEGYSWCKKENKCVQSWELMKSLGLQSTPISFETYCSDCLASAGYSYCYAEQKCVRPWELAKQLSLSATPQAIQAYCAQNPSTKTIPSALASIGGASGTHNCIAGAGYSWCAKENKCVKPWELSTSAKIDNTPEAFEQYCNEQNLLQPLLPTPGLAQNQVESSEQNLLQPLLPTPGLAQNQVESSEEVIGGASGIHNCLTGAGYTWCQTEGKCVRPWELAKEKGMVGMTAESFAAYCQ